MHLQPTIKTLVRRKRVQLLTLTALLYLLALLHHVIIGNQSQYGMEMEMSRYAVMRNTSHVDSWGELSFGDLRLNKSQDSPRHVRNLQEYHHTNCLHRLCEKTFLLIQVHSACKNQPQRDAIRNTWGQVNSLHKKVCLVFLVGICQNDSENIKVEHEMKLYRDMVQLNLIESYENLSTKSVLGMQWVVDYCSKSAFILKCDDDSFIDVGQVVSYLSSFHGYSSDIYGYVYHKARVMRSGLWTVSRQAYPEDYYPDYCSGNNYVINSGAMQKLLACHHDRSAPQLPIEDAYVTGVLAKCANLTLTHEPKFPNWAKTPSLSNFRLLVQGLLFGLHGVDYARMYPIYKMMQNCSSCAQDDWQLRRWFRTIKRTIPML